MNALLRGTWNLATGLPTSSQMRRALPASRDYLAPVVWWLLLVLAVLLALTVVGLPCAVLLAIPLVGRCPYLRPAEPAPAPEPVDTAAAAAHARAYGLPDAVWEDETPTASWRI